jgi:hypothetical protein
MNARERILAAIPQGFELEKAVAEEYAVLFCSLDLVNSTAFKAIHREWPVVISKFYDIAVREVQSISGEFKIWKFVGDEVLLYRVVTDFAQLASDVRNLFGAVNAVVDHLNAIFPYATNFLSVKGTAWLANVLHVPPSEVQDAVKLAVEGGEKRKNIKNMMVEVLTEDFTEGKDFLGPDVDIGFRISKFADKRKLVVSANLARCLMIHSPRESIDLNDFRIVAKEVLKGVWDGRPYPIIWYHENWSQINATFYYDEIETNQIAAKVVGEKVDELDLLPRIYSDLNRQHEVEEVARVIAAGEAKALPVAQAVVNRSKLAEIHCAAICFRADGKILLGKRPKSKKRLEGLWEFGCGQMHLGQDFHDCIRESYREDFSAIIGYISEIPVQTYVITGDRKVPGLLFYAEIENGEEVDHLFVERKHEAIRWLDPADVDNSDENEFVPDFKQSVRLALEHRQRCRVPR